MKNHFLFIFLLLLTSSNILKAQTWFKVAVQDQTVLTTTPVTYRFGAPYNTASSSGSGASPCQVLTGCWTASITTSAPASIFVNPARLGNPILNTLKELDILETAIPQYVQIAGENNTSTTITIPPDPTLNPACITPSSNSKWAEIGGGSVIAPGAVSAILPLGTTYKMHSDACAQIAKITTTISLAADSLDIMYTTNAQVISTTVTPDGPINYIDIPGIPSVPAIDFAIRNLAFDVVVKDTSMHCVLGTTLICSPIVPLFK